jgi:hypothetical protein
MVGRSRGKFTKAPGVNNHDPTTAEFRKFADDQAKANASKGITTYVFEVESLDDVQKCMTGAKADTKGNKIGADEVVGRVDILAHGNDNWLALKGKVVDGPAEVEWELGKPFKFTQQTGFSYSGGGNDHQHESGKTTKDAEGWSKSVSGKLASDAKIFAYSCNSGGMDAPSGATTGGYPDNVQNKGNLISSMAEVWQRPVIGIMAHVRYDYTGSSGSVGIYMYPAGVPNAPRGLLPDSTKNSYRGLDGSTLPGTKLPVTIEAKP